MPGRLASMAPGHPRGDGVLIPIRLSSQTKRTGQGTPRWARYDAVFNAPVAVEWLAEASPKLQTTIASSGHGVGRPRRRASPRANARPTARGGGGGGPPRGGSQSQGERQTDGAWQVGGDGRRLRDDVQGGMTED